MILQFSVWERVWKWETNKWNR